MCTPLIHKLLGTKDLSDFHEYLILGVKAVGMENKMVGEVSVFFVGAFRQCYEDHSTHGVFINLLPSDCVVLSHFSLELVESCHDVISELEIEYRLVSAQVSALPLRLVLLSEFSPRLKSAIRIFALDLVLSGAL